MEEQTARLEEQFLLREFSKCLEQSQSALDSLRDASNTHHCTAPSCACRRIIPLVVQALYELQRPNEVIPFITGFYGDDSIPLSVVSLCAYLLLSIKREDEARNLVLYYLGKASPVPQDGLLVDDSAELSSLLEFYFVQILMPQKDLEEAVLFLRHPLIPPAQRVQFAHQLETRILQRKLEEEQEIRGLTTQQPPAAASAPAAASGAAPASASARPPTLSEPKPTVTKGMPTLPVIVIPDEVHQAQQGPPRAWSELPSRLIHRLRSLVLSNPERFAFYVATFCLLLYIIRQLRKKGFSGIWSSMVGAVTDVLCGCLSFALG